MAQKITTLFIDDIDGGAEEGTVRFALDGTEYEIDLNAKHSEELRSALGTRQERIRIVAASSAPAGRARSSTPCWSRRRSGRSGVRFDAEHDRNQELGARERVRH